MSYFASNHDDRCRRPLCLNRSVRLQRPLLQNNEQHVDTLASRSPTAVANAADQRGRPGDPTYWLGRVQQTTANPTDPLYWWDVWASYQSLHFQGYSGVSEPTLAAYSMNWSNAQGIYGFPSRRGQFRHVRWQCPLRRRFCRSRCSWPIPRDAAETRPTEGSIINRPELSAHDRVDWAA